MPLDFNRARPLLQGCHFRELFVEHLGWESCRQNLTLKIGERHHAFVAVAEKRGFVVWLCESTDDDLPDRATRLKLDRALSQSSFEHLIVFVPPDKSHQSWLWVRREAGRPLRAITHDYSRNQPGDSLLQKLERLFVSLEEEEAGLSVTDISGRVRGAFNVERVTREFYEEFKKQHAAFLAFIEGIGEVADREWYASVMLNRLMFVYFIQRKGFLDGDGDYLRNRLNLCRQEKGKDKFYSFYRYFLLRLFHEGLGGKQRPPELEELLGRIPYLNGGMFDKHVMEERHGDNIQIPDKAFERIFDYFDQYQWHLDERPRRADNEINPDVLGYIFEKYINAIQPGEQKSKGAYYTKEDITEYISKNTVLPSLFDAARPKCVIAFENPNGPTIWDLLKINPDRYIYATIRHGTEKTLPADIAAGRDDSSKRTNWNKPAPSEFALPTEIWHEVVARRKRYEEVRQKLAAGEIRHINNLITLNLDIRQFAQDVIQNCEGPELLRAFWNIIEKVTILDPTCGSGAFLFAALNILEPLYEACLERMESFVQDLDRSNEKSRLEKFSDFRVVLARVASHPNRRYFIFKSIILNNLFGVDVMEEAVEICKLRLFLKLAAQVEPDTKKDNLGIEPLPDIDFNISAGNTIVGYATLDEVQSSMFGRNYLERIQKTDEQIRRFRQRQSQAGDLAEQRQDKQQIRALLSEIREKLDLSLFTEYGARELAGWRKSHQPFHWYVEFNSIIQSGGFDVIIGNPPYVEYKDVKNDYQIRGYRTEACSNLFAYVLERCTQLSRSGSEVGMIIPLSAFSTDRMIPLITELKSTSCNLNIANFSWRPGKLFDGVNLQLSILLQKVGQQNEEIETTRYLMWDSEARPELFSKIEYVRTDDNRLAGSIPKLGASEAASILKRLRSHKREIAGCFTRKSNNKVYYRRGGLYWKVFVDFVTGSSEEKIIHLLPEIDKYTIIAALSSDLWWWYFTITSDCRHLGNRDIATFPFDPREMGSREQKTLAGLGKDYVEDLKRNAVDAVRVYKGKKSVDCLSFRVNQSKPILDEIDRLLARYYGFTAGELDFILNYDIKYRLGRGAEDEDE